MSAEQSWQEILVSVLGGHNILSWELCDLSTGDLRRTRSSGLPWARDSLRVPQRLSSSSDGASGCSEAPVSSDRTSSHPQCC